MVEYPPTSINIESYIQDYDSTLASKTESHKSTVVLPHKKDKTSYHQVTQLLYRRVQKLHPIKKKIPK